jgi:hypothetical protein
MSGRGLTGVRLLRGSEGVQQPDILRLLMAKNVEIAVIGQHLETLIAHAVPLIQDFFDFEHASAGLVLEGKPKWPFIGLVAGIAFDFETAAHLISTHLSF